MEKLTNLYKSTPGDISVSPDIDPSELAIGVQSEMEHTNDIKIAKQIAIDHLKEDPKYYTKLAKAGLAHDFDYMPSSGYGDPDALFNDESRVGDQFSNGNMGGNIGNTPNGEVSGRRSEPIVNKTLEIELEEAKKKKSKKKPKPTNPKLWAAAKAWAKRTFDVYPSAYANGAAAKRYKKQGGKWKMSESKNLNNEFNISTNISDHSDVEIFENKKHNTSIMSKKYNLKDVKNTIKQLVKEAIEDQENALDTSVDTSVDTSMDTGTDVQDAMETGEENDVTLTMDRETAKKLYDLLATVVGSDESEDKSSMGGEDETEESDESGETLQESRKISVAKKIVKSLRR